MAEKKESRQPSRKIGVFGRYTGQGDDVSPIAVDMDTVTCITLSKITGEVMIVTNGQHKGTIVIADGFNQALDIWKGKEDIVVFHTKSNDPTKSIPCAVAARSILSLDVSRKTNETLLNTVNGVFVLTDSFMDAVKIWSA